MKWKTFFWYSTEEKNGIENCFWRVLTVVSVLLLPKMQINPRHSPSNEFSGVHCSDLFWFDFCFILTFVTLISRRKKSEFNHLMPLYNIDRMYLFIVISIQINLDCFAIFKSERRRETHREKYKYCQSSVDRPPFCISATYKSESHFY